MENNIDLFEHLELVPQEVRVILSEFDEEADGYKECARVVKLIEELGYTYDYYLDAEPFNLRKIYDLDYLKIAIDNESLNIFYEMPNDVEPIHVLYWHEDEWLEDAEMVVPSMLNAMQLFYTNKKQLLEVLKINLEELVTENFN